MHRQGQDQCALRIGRKLDKLGHKVRLLPAQYVKPYLKGHKNDFRDAQAIAEAVQRPTMRFVPLKSAEQLDLQALHRARSRLVTQRTAVINQIRGFLLERGLPVRQGAVPDGALWSRYANARSNAASSLSKCLPDVGGGTLVKTLPENRRAANLPSLDREDGCDGARSSRG